MKRSAAVLLALALVLTLLPGGAMAAGLPPAGEALKNISFMVEPDDGLDHFVPAPLAMANLDWGGAGEYGAAYLTDGYDAVLPGATFRLTNRGNSGAEPCLQVVLRVFTGDGSGVYYENRDARPMYLCRGGFTEAGSGWSEPAGVVKLRPGESVTFALPEARFPADSVFRLQINAAYPSYGYQYWQYYWLLADEDEVARLREEQAPVCGFIDVKGRDWFAGAVRYAVENGLMNGTGGSRFSPGGNTTRGQLMTILARLDGVDTADSRPWYQTGMEWAKERGVSDGTNPEKPITREQFAAMLYRYAGEPEAGAGLGTFPDAGKVSGWAAGGMNWAVEQGIINGSGGRLDPQGTATRAQAATMLMRYRENILNKTR